MAEIQKAVDAIDGLMVEEYGDVVCEALAWPCRELIGCRLAGPTCTAHTV